MAEMSGIYLIKNIVNNKVYVGSSKRVKERLRYHRYHLKANKHFNKKLQNAWNKYGCESFEFLILENVASEELLIETEQKWIDFYKSSSDGYNIRQLAHANYGVVVSEETRKKLSIALTGKVFSEERRRNISNGLIGRKVSKEQIERQRLKILGRKPTAQEIENKRKGMLGHKVSDECRAKISAAHKGRIVKEETKEKLRQANLGKKQSLEIVNKRKLTVANMSEEKKLEWGRKLSEAGKLRKIPKEVSARAWATRRANQEKLNIKER